MSELPHRSSEECRRGLDGPGFLYKTWDGLLMERVGVITHLSIKPDTQ